MHSKWQMRCDGESFHYYSPYIYALRPYLRDVCSPFRSTTHRTCRSLLIPQERDTFVRPCSPMLPVLNRSRMSQSKAFKIHIYIYYLIRSARAHDWCGRTSSPKNSIYEFILAYADGHWWRNRKKYPNEIEYRLIKRIVMERRIVALDFIHEFCEWFYCSVNVHSIYD